MSKRIFISVLLFSLIIQVIFVEELNANTAEERLLEVENQLKAVANQIKQYEGEKTNLEIIYEICKILEKDPENHIDFVEDRLGHDFRYAIDAKKIRRELKWKPKHTFKKALKKTILSYA